MAIRPEHRPDNIFSKTHKAIRPFEFDGKVAEVFPDMIRRSVPGYADIIDMIRIFAGRYVQAHSNCYDLGTSLGAAARAMQEGINAEGCCIYAVDNSADMLERCEQHGKQHGERGYKRKQLPGRTGARIEYVLEDIEDTVIEDASMVVLNFTLQFVPPGKRSGILSGICRGLRPGGVCIISEKLRFDEKPQESLMPRLHEDFKRTMGYSNLEISQKRQSLENVLVPNSEAEMKVLIENAGFKTWFIWFQHLAFHSFIAVK